MFQYWPDTKNFQKEPSDNNFFIFLFFQRYQKLMTIKLQFLYFLTFPVCFWIPIMFSNLNLNCSILLDMRNLHQQVKKAFCYQKLFWPSTVWINCSCDLKLFSNSRPSASNFKSSSRSLEQFFLTVGQNNFGNKRKLISDRWKFWHTMPKDRIKPT